MIPLLKLAIEAHGGLERWRRVHRIDLKLTIGGGLWELKGLPQGLVDVALHVEPAYRLVTITPFGPQGRASQFLQRLATEQAALFVHWNIGMTGTFN